MEKVFYNLVLCDGIENKVSLSVPFDQSEIHRVLSLALKSGLQVNVVGLVYQR